ncbi:MAG: hypothetical protein RLZZ171_2122 [Cyanobacteriota bacterium]|jgi:hypothetical protein
MSQAYQVSQNYVDTFYSDLINVKHSASAKIDYSIDSGSQFRQVGQTGGGSCVTNRGLLPTNYSLQYFSIDTHELAEWQAMSDLLEGSTFAIPFNDPADNAVVAVAKNGVAQYGALIGHCSIPNTFRAYKVYEAGQRRTFYPIYYYEPSSEILINDVDISTLDITLDRQTGIFTSALPLDTYSFETDLYYKLVKITSPILFQHTRAAGIAGVGVGSDIELRECFQSFDVSLSLQEIFLSESFATPVSEVVDTNDNLTFLDLEKHQNDLLVGSQFNNIKEELNGVSFTKRVIVGQRPITKVTIPGREARLSDLNYWKTIYLATSGGCFDITY